MVRGRSVRCDFEMTTAQNGGKNAGHLSSTVAGHPARHFRQFTTRSRTKSAASFKNLHRILSHDGTSEFDNNGNTNSFVKSKSSDALYRKRAISGLNMTNLTRVRSNPGHNLRSRSGSMASAHSLGTGAGTSRLRPSRSKSTHLVVDMHEGDELFDNDTTTDEEVEYFTDEEDESSNKGQKSAGDLKKQTEEQELVGTQKSNSLPRTLSDLTAPLEENEEKEAIIMQQASSNLPRGYTDERTDQKMDDTGVSGFLVPDLDNTDGSMSKNDDHHIHHDGEDHISNSNLNVYEADNLIANSLERQNNGKMKGRDLPQLPDHDEQPANDGQVDEFSQRRNSATEQYIPSMILSQSTGAVRRFEQPPSIQNSLSNNYHVANVGDMIQDKEANNRKQELHSDSKNSRSAAEMEGNSQHYPNGTSSAADQNHFSTSISSLTNSLLRAAPNGLHSSTRMSHLMRKRTSQNSLVRSDLRSANGTDAPTSALHRENAGPVSSINNFAQFLKSDVMDGESRTQRKLWLQRENSIMDLSAHNDGGDSVFMAGNIEVKREFERISHEYTNVRRFCNPVEEALSRVDIGQNVVGVRRSKIPDADIVETLFPDDGAKDNKVDQFLPKTQDTKLHRILSSIWKDETALFNKDINPVSGVRTSGSTHHFHQPNRSSLRSGFGSSTALQHQRTINSLQPTTRAVNRRMENAIHHQQRL
ncbi:hypothetical protein HG537_0C03900 [Torulaspora globosa]|uniref:Uncharacterized protein n=1 Tax=Torulaspora globosa TaxID=48254 RepID=A0A7H9HR38_9SACH|nr:hypothetical protein HG537_0C03900 [Torulaspora sp. CBS 2947]